jgi:hypothetical protein
MPRRTILGWHPARWWERLRWTKERRKLLKKHG